MNQRIPKDPKIDPYSDYESGVHIVLEDPAYRCFDFAHSDFARFSQKLTNRTKLLKSPKKGRCWRVRRVGSENVTVPF